MKIKIAIVEDNPHLTKSLFQNFMEYKDIEIVFTAINGKKSLDALAGLPEDMLPEVMLVDIEMPEMDGIEATAKIRVLYKDIKIIMLTVFDQDEKIFDSILAGASGYMLKDDPMPKIVEGINDIMNGGAAMSPVIASKALSLLRNGGIRPVSESEKSTLSKREMEILEQVANGLSYTQMADKMFISPGTVRKHIENIYQKLQVHTKLEAVQLANKKNWFGTKLSAML